MKEIAVKVRHQTADIPKRKRALLHHPKQAPHSNPDAQLRVLRERDSNKISKRIDYPMNLGGARSFGSSC